MAFLEGDCKQSGDDSANRRLEQTPHGTERDICSLDGKKLLADLPDLP